MTNIMIELAFKSRGITSSKTSNDNNNDNNNFIYMALISWAHGALQCKKGENEIIYISQAWNLFTIIMS